MTWQTLIWNIFVWTFTGVMIYLKNASMWWLLIPVLFTGFMNGVELYKNTESKDQEYKGTADELVNMDPKSKKELFELIIKSSRDEKKRERL